jgi:hypothetical protein
MTPLPRITRHKVTKTRSQGNLARTPDVAVVISLNWFMAPVDDTVTAEHQSQVTSHPKSLVEDTKSQRGGGGGGGGGGFRDAGIRFCLWAHVRVLDVIKSDVDELDLQLDITLDNVFVVIVREVVQIARGVSKKNVNQVLVGNTNENLACALGIDGSIFDIARWSGSVNHQATCV